MSILESLHWRYATKRMTGERVPQEKIDIILESARMAPTSSGIQPFTIFVVTDKKLMQKIQSIAHNQPQITEASHLLVFAAWDSITPEKIDYVYDQIIRERNLPAGALTAYVNRLKDMFAAMTPEEQFSWAANQTYLAFGITITAAAIEKIDATPMEGFVNSELDKLLGLKEKDCAVQL
jgi:nitroreductase